MRLLLLFGLALAHAAPLLAQVNIETLRSVDKDGLALSFSTDVMFRSGNSNFAEVGMATRLDYRHTKHYTFVTGSLRYGEQGGSAFRDRSFLHLRYNYDLSSQLVWEAFTQIERDRFTLLKSRALGGTGLRLRLRLLADSTSRVQVFPGTSLMLEHEVLDRDKVAEHPATVTAPRWSSYVNIRLKLTDTVSLIQTLYVQPRLDAFADIRLLNDAALAISLTKRVTLTTTFNLRYDARPPDNIESLDIFLRNGVSVRL